MKILVPVKQARTVEEDFELRDDHRDVDLDFVDHEFNEWDDYSLETALQLKEAHDDVEVVAVTVADEEEEDSLRTAMAKGADRAIRVWEDGLEEADALLIGRVLAGVAEQEQPDLLLVGTQSPDYASSATGVALAAHLGWPHAAVVVSLDYTPGSSEARVERELEGGLRERVSVDCPAVLTIQLGINKPRYASLRGIKQARQRPIEERSLDDVGVGAAVLDDPTARGHNIRRVRLPEAGQAEFIEGTPAEQAERIVNIISEVMGR